MKRLQAMTAGEEAKEQSKQHEGIWRSLVEQYLPVVPSKSGWRYYPGTQRETPSQGWKLHVSSTLPNAIEVFRRCAPLLSDRGVAFKSVKNLGILGRINSAIPFGFSQIGKFITVYPTHAEQALELAELLHQATRDFPAPAVPFDLPYRHGSAVYYRYGAYGHEELVLDDGNRVGAIRAPSGELVPDLREPGKAVPDWAECPFDALPDEAAWGTPLQTQYLCYEALMQRGKGGVYRAVNITGTPAALCVVKEGRRHGETNWRGDDGRTFVEREEALLRAMTGLDCAPPHVIDSFCIADNRYLVVEHIDGEPLLQACADPSKKLGIELALAYGAAVAKIVADLHQADWVWRDLKPANLLVEKTGRLRPVDFEGALRTWEATRVPWGTPSYMPPEVKQGAVTGSHVPEDLFGLGATIHQLLTSWLMHQSELDQPAKGVATQRPPVGRLRKGVPLPVRQLVASLMHADPTKRPSAQQAYLALQRYEMPALPVPPTIKRDSAIVKRVREKLWKEVQEMVLIDPEQIAVPA